MDSFKEESTSYVIDGVEKRVTDEMWQQVMTEFDQNNIPKRRYVLYSVARRAIDGDPILPLTQKQSGKEYVK